MTTKKALEGERTIKLEIYFFTNKLAKDGHVQPKHAWAAGMVTIAANETHGIGGGSPVPFHSLLGIPAAIEKVLKKRGVRLHVTREMKKYMES